MAYVYSEKDASSYGLLDENEYEVVIEKGWCSNAKNWY